MAFVKVTAAAVPTRQSRGITSRTSADLLVCEHVHGRGPARTHTHSKHTQLCLRPHSGGEAGKVIICAAATTTLAHRKVIVVFSSQSSKNVDVQDFIFYALANTRIIHLTTVSM